MILIYLGIASTSALGEGSPQESIALSEDSSYLGDPPVGGDEFARGALARHTRARLRMTHAETILK
eukprot:scaffold324362_cov57-Tisochrysis_lutea.AAC.3